MKDKIGTTGMGFNKNDINEEFPYFDVFERLYGNKESFTPSHILDTGKRKEAR